MLKTVAWEENAKMEDKAALTAALDARVEHAEARTEQAESRTEEAKARTEHAEIRTEQAETRTEQAKTRTERAEIRTEQAETRSEQAIRDSEISYRRLFEAAQDGILILEADTGVICDANPFLTEMLGSSHAELVNKAVWELGAFRDICSNKARFEELRHQGYARYENLALETRDNRRIAVEFVSNVYQAGVHNVIQCHVRDNTERQRLEERSRAINAELEERVTKRTAQLQSVNEQLEAFSLSVSHDLRAPLRHMMGFVDLLQTEGEPPLSEVNLAYLAKISNAADRMGKMIDGLLSFSRLGESEMQRAQVNLGELVNEVVADFQAETKERKIAWEIGPLPAVKADRALLRQALVNLVSNAVKFTGGRAEARIEIGCALSAEGETSIFIRDNGAGFDPVHVHKLFGVFQRLHGEEEFEGTGVGLANVRRIIQKHGGRVWAEGMVDQGATFYFSIPKRSGSSNCDDQFPSGA